MHLARELGVNLADQRLAQALDEADPLAHLRQEFSIPQMKDIKQADLKLVEAESDCIYLCGNSLGLMPKRTRTIVNEELDTWATGGVTGHFPDGPGKRPWVSIDETVTDKCARVVGALPEEVAIMNTLTVNLHLLMVSLAHTMARQVPFYRPTSDRFKILVEAKAFPSDHFAVLSQLRMHGHDESALIEVKPREGEHNIREEDLLAILEEQGDSIATVLVGGVHYYTGQFFDLQRLCAAAHNKGCTFGVDLAHAVGNVPLQLHDWDIDFACWCTYKYLNSGPGGIAGAFIHKKHEGTSRPYLQGWWGVQLNERFRMDHDASFMPGVRGLQLSNPGVLQTVALLGSLEIYEQTDMASLRAKSLKLTAYLEQLMQALVNEEGHAPRFEIITPTDPERRGCQLSILFKVDIDAAFEALEKRGVVCDVRRPDVMRIAPVPLYNTFTDVYRFVTTLRDALNASASS
ncbi:uncharacterized protein MONBRDRAFT_26773 [Monosiga brevicollis MX1]|uniref:Kynureninase n=1 Tax=Monosiga brevicollis TaxID=81824 RepID=KYNU_MONBE|nr:uncharacterized protein MONBRDRAFT_26773 [Monosiga brevicollis MX1]A9V3C0.1 RecName: Full=Kynureninase; AltName: Full=L-kynurenine hydrolase [Monosiga brevicollis]EDQ88034.1 predicted protein [Monosiga brevicollis MX1]|eukprot:XP_001747110.1 hypothetical protein [Monosiga brevicollis MX1]